MTLSRFLLCWLTAVLSISLIVFVLMLERDCILRPSVVCNAITDDTDNPPYSSVLGAHNFRVPNRVITEYNDDVARRLASLVERRATATDPELIRLIADMMDQPSRNMIKMSRQLFSTPQSREVDNILKNKVITNAVSK